MKAKDLINLLKTINQDDDVLSPVADQGFSGQFKLIQKTVILDADGKADGLPPYTLASDGDSGSEQKYILDCYWSQDYDFDKRRKKVSS
jgi:hypothetical protein